MLQEHQSHSNIPRSRSNRPTTTNVSESADYEENELRPIELKMTNSSIATLHFDEVALDYVQNIMIVCLLVFTSLRVDSLINTWLLNAY